jgi:hypothetical protein
MFDTHLTTHIKSNIQSCYPAISTEEILVSIPKSQLFAAEVNRWSALGKKVLYTEVLSVSVDIFTNEKIDRHTLIQKFPIEDINIDGNQSSQKVIGCHFYDYIESSKLKQTRIILEYQHNIYGE